MKQLDANLRLQTGDHIIEVNGVHGDGDSILAEIKKPMLMNWKVERYRLVQVVAWFPGAVQA